MRSVLLLAGLCGVLAGCSLGGGNGTGSSGPALPVERSTPKKATMTIEIRAVSRGGSRLVRSRTLGCNPATGSVSNTKAACTALRDYVRHSGVPGPACSCPGAPVGTRFAIIKGTLDGKPVRAELFFCMCGVAQRLIDDLQIVTGLRRFFPA